MCAHTNAITHTNTHLHRHCLMCVITHIYVIQMFIVAPLFIYTSDSSKYVTRMRKRNHAHKHASSYVRLMFVITHTYLIQLLIVAPLLKYTSDSSKYVYTHAAHKRNHAHKHASSYVRLLCVDHSHILNAIVHCGSAVDIHQRQQQVCVHACGTQTQSRTYMHLHTHGLCL